MSDKTAIQWTDMSWSPWWGCAPVSPGCANCYASGLAVRFRGFKYRKGGPRQKTKDWAGVERWNARAIGRTFVFPSMCDPFDEEVPSEWFDEFFLLVNRTISLTWLLLTKRPENIRPMMEDFGKRQNITFDGFPDNVWLGVSVEDQKRADERLPILRSIPATVRFLSVEPMLERIIFDYTVQGSVTSDFAPKWAKGISWVIFGGESGIGSRPCDIDWIRDGVQQCRAAGLAPFVKQLGSHPIEMVLRRPEMEKRVPLRLQLKDSKGGEPSEWPADLRVREFPKV